jgi:protein ImuB
VLLSELETDVGAENVGLLRIEDAHAPEARSRLEPILARPGPKRASQRARKSTPPDPLARATRLLTVPAALSVPLRVGESFVLGQSYYTIEKLEFATRLEHVAWWTNSAQSRDYVWAWLSGSSGGLQALLFVDRRSKRAYVQGLAD